MQVPDETVAETFLFSPRVAERGRFDRGGMETSSSVQSRVCQRERGCKEPEANRRRRACCIVASMMLAGSFLAFITVLPGGVRAATLYVGGGGPANYSTIQAAIDAASPGDTIFVYNGTYNENILIPKPLSLIGENKDTTIIDGGGTGDVVNITADWVDITGFTITNGGQNMFDAGIDSTGRNGNIADNRFSSDWAAVFLNGTNPYVCSYITVANNNFSDNFLGIFSVASACNTISGNTVTLSAFVGIYIIFSDNTTLVGNTVSYNNAGIGVDFSNDNTLQNNVLMDDGIYLVGEYMENWVLQTIDASNTVNGKPVYYSRNQVGGTVPTGAGEVILANARGVTVKDQNISKVEGGIQLGFSSGNTIINNNISENGFGAWLYFSSDNTIANNTASHGLGGIYLYSSFMSFSTNNLIANNTFSFDEHEGVYLDMYSLGNTLLGNNISSNNGSGVYIEWGADSIVIANNVISSNNGSGIYAFDNYNHIITGNVITANNLSGIDLFLTTGVKVTNNTFFGNREGLSLATSFGGNTITNNEFLNNTRDGIISSLSDGDVIVSNNFTHNAWGGIDMIGSTSTTIAANNFTENGLGVYLFDSYTNTIYHNNFINNTEQAYDDVGSNSWDDGYPSGGNYWSDYNGSDNYSGPNQNEPGGDGIGDTPYNISGGSNKDRYPLMYRVGPPPWHPTAPQNLQATEGVYEVALSWAAPTSNGGDPITNYVIYRGDSPGTETYFTETVDVLTYTDSGLTNRTQHYYKVAAKNSVGMGPRSNGANGMPITAPGAPSGLVASPGDGQVTLTWSAPVSDGGSPITNYRIYRGPISGGETFLTEIGNVLSYTDSGLTNGLPYFYTMAARNSAGVGPNSTEANATPAKVPTSPVNLQGSAGDGQVTLTWNAPSSTGGSPITNYLVYRGLSSGTKTLLIEVGDVLTYVDSAVTNGQTYYYEVSAKNAVGEGARSNEAVATPLGPPAPPTSLVAAGGDSRVALTWSPPTDDGGSAITNYSVYRGTTPGSETFLTRLDNLTTYLDTGLVNGQLYCYLVSAENVKGESGRSNEVCALAASVPGRPEGFAATARNGKVDLGWSAPSSDGGSPVTGYRIYRGTSPGGESLLVLLGDVLAYSDSDVTIGVMYYYTVAALNAIGQGLNSTEASAKPFDVPSEPLNVVAIAGDSQATLTWDPPVSDGGLPITNYAIYRGTVSGAEMLLTEAGDVVTYTDTGLNNGMTYYYQIASKNSFGESGRSAEASATPSTEPTEPRNINVVAGPGTLTLTWTPPASDGGSPVTNYRLYRGTVPGGETFLVEVGNVVTYVDGSVSGGQTYYYKVSAKNAMGEGPLSSEATGTPPAVPGPPTAVTAVASVGRVTLGWSPPSNDGGSSIIDYAVYRGTISGGEALLARVGNTTTFVDTNVTTGQTYYYTVSARNAVGEGPQSGEVGATPAAIPPVAIARGGNRAQVGEAVTFDGTESLGNVTKYVWTIRDEGGQVIGSLEGSVVTYAFQKAGRYVVTLNVTDESTGLSSEITLEILVVEGFNIWLLLLLAVALTAAYLVGRTEVVRVALLTLLVAPAHGRKLKGREEPETRGLIRGYIIGNPGGCYTDIQKALDLNDGSVAWHLMKLEKDGTIKSKIQGTRKRYYPARMSLPEEDAWELLEIQKLLLGTAFREPGSTVRFLANEVGVSRQLALYHLRRLQLDGRLSFEKKGLHMRVYVATKQRTGGLT